MKKVIILCLILLISSVVFFAIHEAGMMGKARELFRHDFPEVKTPVSLIAEILVWHIQK
jgi:Mg2+/Co2+ transporter CorB